MIHWYDWFIIPLAITTIFALSEYQREGFNDKFFDGLVTALITSSCTSGILWSIYFK